MLTGFIPNNTGFFACRPAPAAPVAMMMNAETTTPVLTTPPAMTLEQISGYGGEPGIVRIGIVPHRRNGLEGVFTVPPYIFMDSDELVPFDSLRISRYGSGCRLAWNYPANSVRTEDDLSVTLTDQYVYALMGDRVPGGWSGNGKIRIDSVYQRTGAAPFTSRTWEKIEEA